MATPISEINHNLTLDSNVDTGSEIKMKAYIIKLLNTMSLKT
jgi:hypothetical protein